MALENERRPPVVFISYSHDSAAHADRVLALSNRLRRDGIDCILDQYEDSPPEGWPRWMDRHIRSADFVLMICTETYYKRVMGEEKPGTGQGVRWEGNLIYQHIYNADTKNTRFLPILFEDGLTAHIPAPCQGATRYSVDTDEGYELLYRRLTNQPRVHKPGLGRLKKLPSVEPRERKEDFASPVHGTWPGVLLPHGGPKISEPFAGREGELKELNAAMAGHKKIAAVIGMAGQGKSCLIGEWYKRGARPPAGIGLFWRKVYEAGYTFDRFLDDLHLYLAGEPIDRLQVRTVRERAVVVEGLLDARPCWIVLDGMERWLRRWASDPDAEAQSATPDDRAACESAFDGFLKGACFRENGSRLLLTTRALPSALDEDLPAMVGDKHGYEKRLMDLKSEDALRLLDDLEVKGEEATKREAATAYACHAYAVHVLGVLIHDLYGGDASRWREVNPLHEPGPAGLFHRILETCKDDLPLLDLVACSLGPAPVEMLAELTARDEDSIRRSLAELKKWQMVEFEGSNAEQHTIVRQCLLGRVGSDAGRTRHKQIAAWWSRRSVPVNPTKIEEIRPLLQAVERLVAARDPDAATDILQRKSSPEAYYAVDGWLRAFGYLDEDIRINSAVIAAYLDLIETEGRRELRNDLARCYNNRGLALAAQGHLAEAIADYGRAIEITEGLVEREGRRELRNDLARCYNNRGAALRAQGHLAEAIADYGRAIEIREGLVEREGRRELRGDLESSLFNRALAQSQMGEWRRAGEDTEKGMGLLRALVAEGQRHILSSLFQTLGFRCRYAKELGGRAKTVQGANEAMQWFLEEVGQNRTTEPLLKAAAEFAEDIRGNQKLLSKHGLDESLWQRFQASLGRS